MNRRVRIADYILEFIYKNKTHRIHGPAIIEPNGREGWWINGKLYQVHESAIGSQRWYKNNKLHRLDGPAVTYMDGTQLWFKNGKRHREDGPAVIDSLGKEEWWKNGIWVK